MADELIFLIFTFLSQPEGIVCRIQIQELSAHQWMFRTPALFEVAQADKKSGPNLSPHFLWKENSH